MRILKIILAIIGILLIIVVTTGLLVPTFEYGNVIGVAASPEKCWAIFHDTSRMKKWNDGFESLIQTKGDTLELGAEYRLTINQGEVMEMNQKIVALAAPHSISYELTNDVLKSEYIYTFDAEQEKTNITTHYKVTGNNVLMKAILLFSKSYLSNADQKMLQLLKNEIESSN
jgi:hypothetical protein